jgi:hypothetical protein
MSMNNKNRKNRMNFMRWSWRKFKQQLMKNMVKQATTSASSFGWWFWYWWSSPYQSNGKHHGEWML